MEIVNHPTTQSTMMKFATELRTFPLQWNYEFSNAAKASLLDRLYRYVSADFKYADYFFPDGMGNDPLKWLLPDENTTSRCHDGRPCAHRLQKGEPTYRCKDCSLDDTCVLCENCFNPEDHRGHQINISITSSLHQSSYGGVCDCGDPEAWVRELKCKSSGKSKVVQGPVPDELKQSLYATIERSLDFVLDVFCCSPQGSQFQQTATSIRLSEQSFALDPEAYGGEDVPCDKKYSLYLWDDEKHSFADAMTFLHRATERSMSECSDLAQKVDREGRAVVKTSSNIGLLLSMKSTIERTGLVLTIRPTRDCFREEMACVILEWISSLSGKSIGQHTTLARDFICEILINPWKQGTKFKNITTKFKPLYSGTYDSSEEDDAEDADDHPPMSMSTDRDASGSLLRHNIDESIASTPTGSSDSRSTEDTTDRNHNNNNNNNGPPSYWIDPRKGQSQSFKTRSRIEFLFLFDLRLWKPLRKTVHDLYVSTLSSHPDYKVQFGMQFAKIYPELLELYMVADRQPEWTVMGLTTQLYNSPKVATAIAKSYALSDMLATLYSFLTTASFGPVSSLNLNAALPSDAKNLKNRRFSQIFTDIDYILTRNRDPTAISCNPDKVRQVSDIVLLFEGVCPIERQLGQHVEYESDNWVIYFNILPSVLQLAREFATGLQSTPNKGPVLEAIHIVSKYLTIWSMGVQKERFKDNEVTRAPTFVRTSCDIFDHNLHSVVRFAVDHEPLSIHHPLHAFLTWMVEYGQLPDADSLKSSLFCSALDSPFSKLPYLYPSEEMFMTVVDYPLRVLVCLTQIKVGLWVRNGFGIRSQQHHYRESIMKENGYCRDIMMVQLGLSMTNPARAMLTLVNRFGLDSWMRGNFARDEMDDSQLLYMVEEFVQLVTVLLSNRTRLMGYDRKTTNNKLIEREIIQCLCLQPNTFSEMVKTIPYSLRAEENFEHILKSVTTFRKPKGLNDKGMYVLKPEYFQQVDPCYIHYSATLREESEQATKLALAQQNLSPLDWKDPVKKKAAVEGIVLEPPLVEIKTGPFMRLCWIVGSPAFVQFVFFSLLYVYNQKEQGNSRADSLLSAVLYLCHVAALDDNTSEKHESNTSYQESFTAAACKYSVLEEEPSGYSYPILQTLPKRSLFGLFWALFRHNGFQDEQARLRRIFSLMKQASPEVYTSSLVELNVPPDIFVEKADDYQSTASIEAERKRKMAKERQSKIMAEFARRQQAFAAVNNMKTESPEPAATATTSTTFDNEGDVVFGDDDETGGQYTHQEEMWEYPSGSCIVCLKSAEEEGIFGTIGLMQPNAADYSIPLDDSSWLRESLEGAKDFDRPKTELKGAFADDVEDITAWDSDNYKGIKIFPSNAKEYIGHIYSTSPVTTVSCGHIMHLKCYEEYVLSVRSRVQIARNHAENVELKEFLCPLCKSLNNIFLPILWKGNTMSLIKATAPNKPFNDWLNDDVKITMSRMDKKATSALSSSTFQRKSMPHRVRENFVNSNKNVKILDTLSSSGTALQQAISGFSDRSISFDPQLRMAIRFLGDNPSANIGEAIDFSLRQMYASIDGILNSFAKSENDKMDSILSVGATTTNSNRNRLGKWWKMMASSISSVEISIRGTLGADDCLGSTLLDQVPSRTMDLLRILSQTLSSYIALALKSEDSEITTELVNSYEQQFRLLFPNAEERKDDAKWNRGWSQNDHDFINGVSFLGLDPFTFICEAAYCLCPAFDFSLHHILKLCYYAEITRAVIWLCSDSNGKKLTKVIDEKFFKVENLSPMDKMSIGTFCSTVCDTLVQVSFGVCNENNLSIANFSEDVFIGLVERLITPFLRKAAILFGVKNTTGYNSEEFGEYPNEVSRLLALLKLESVMEFFRYSTEESISTVRVMSLVDAYVYQFARNARERENYVEKKLPPYIINMPYPGIYRLIELPKRLDGFFSMVSTEKCKSCHTVPPDPAICLFCGQLSCQGSHCCSDRLLRIGECNQHTKECGHGVGLFLLVKKAVILLLRHGQGTFIAAPYLDIHGEVDEVLKRGGLQFLSQLRYDRLIRDRWLQHDIPNIIARKIENQIDIGGWETL